MTTQEEFDSWLVDADEAFVEEVNADVDHAMVLHTVERIAAERTSSELSSLVAVAAVTGAPSEKTGNGSLEADSGVSAPSSDEFKADNGEVDSLSGAGSAELDRTFQFATDGVPEAVDQLMQNVRPIVVRYCRVRVGERGGTFAAADDIAQDICLAALAKLPNVRGSYRDFLRLVFGIAEERVYSRGVEPLRLRLVTDLKYPAYWRRLAIKYAVGRSIPNWSQLLSELPEQERKVLVLRVLVGLSVADTSEVVGRSARWVRFRQHRALNMLRKLVAGT